MRESATRRSPKENKNRGVQQRAPGLLFGLLSLTLVAVAVAAITTTDRGVRWLIALAALALAGWLGSLALSVLRK
jgi:hypothetical protein